MIHKKTYKLEDKNGLLALFEVGIGGCVKSPNNNKNMNIFHGLRKVKYRGIDITYMHYFYVCEKTEQFYTTSELDDVNTLNMVNEYNETIINRKKLHTNLCAKLNEKLNK
jgi:hypothetical protein